MAHLTNRCRCRMVLCPLCAVLLCGVCLGDDAPISHQRWEEHAYGISLLSPEDAVLYERIADDAIPWTLGLSTGATKSILLQDLRSRFRLDRIRKKMLGRITAHPDDPQSDRDLLQALRTRHSIAPENKAHLLSAGTTDALMQIEGPDGYTIRFYLRQTEVDHHINKIAQSAVREIADLWPSTILLEQKPIEVAGRGGVLLYFKIPLKNGGRRALAQALFPVQPRVFALLQLDTPFVQLQRNRGALETVIDSVTIRSPQQIHSKRAQDLERGQMWKQMLDTSRMHARLNPLQLMRIVQGGRDIGYLRIEMFTTKELGLAGMAVVVRAREYQQAHVHDTQSKFFLSDDDTHELWQIKSTVTAPQKLASNTLTTAESGLRSGNSMEVTRQDLSGKKTLRWEKPQGYLSQVELHLAESLLPHKTSREMGFYTYLPAANSITYRSVAIVPLDDGGYRVFTRASPQHGLSVAEYDATGKFLGRLLPGGRALIPTTAKAFKKIWRVK